MHDRLEIEIDICADNAKDLKRDLDIIHIYEHLMRTTGWNIGDKFLINEEWRTLVVDIENTFTKNVCHVERFRAVKGEQRVCVYSYLTYILLSGSQHSWGVWQ